MAVVFMVLIVLWGLIALFSAVLRRIDTKFIKKQIKRKECRKEPLNMLESLVKLFQDSGFSQFTWQNGVMILISLVLVYLAIVKKFEPLLLLPIARRITYKLTARWVNGENPKPINLWEVYYITYTKV